MTPREVLIAAKALIDTPEKWTQGMFMRHMKKGTAFCILGACMRVTNHPFGDGEYVRAKTFLLRVTVEAVDDWNDAPERTHAEVMDAFTRAIELAADAETVANLNRDLAAVVP